MTTSRGYVLTFNNPSHSKEDILKHLKTRYKASLKYAVLNLEQGEKKGTQHIQGYIEFKTPIQFEGLRKALVDYGKPHIEKRQGKPSQANDYIMHQGEHENKGGLIEKAITYGKLPSDEQGKRNDLRDIAQLLENGATPKDIRIEYPSHYLRMKNHIHSLYQEIIGEQYMTKKRDIKVYYIYGESRTGKTSGIYDYHGFDNVYRVSNYDHPFDTYNQEKILMLEEFHSSLPISYMLQLLEGYPLMLKARYNDKVATYDTVYIVSNKALADQYHNVRVEQPKTYNAFVNRIEYVITVKQYGDLQNAMDTITKGIDFGGKQVSIRVPKQEKVKI